MTDLLAKTSARYVKPKFVQLKAGDSVRVYTRIKEGDKERTQYFEGVVIKQHGGIGTNATFTVRRGTGIGVERTFPLHSPVIERIEVQRGAKVRKAQLHYLRGRTGKAARLVEEPAKQSDRETEHPWPKQFHVEHKEMKAAAEVASKDQLQEEEAEAEAAAEEKPQAEAEQADKKAEAKDDKPAKGDKDAAKPDTKATADDKPAKDTDAKDNSKADAKKKDDQ